MLPIRKNFGFVKKLAEHLSNIVDVIVCQWPWPCFKVIGDRPSWNMNVTFWMPSLQRINILSASKLICWYTSMISWMVLFVDDINQVFNSQAAILVMNFKFPCATNLSGNQHIWNVTRLLHLNSIFGVNVPLWQTPHLGPLVQALSYKV